jgi:hypothetical protein
MSARVSRMPVSLAVVPSTTETFMLIDSLLANTSLVHYAFILDNLLSAKLAWAQYKP